MENLLSVNQNGGIQHVPDSYMLPPETRPGKVVVPTCKAIPVIQLLGNIDNNRQELVQKIIKASQEYGFFQLSDHGVPEELMLDVLKLAEEFFQLPAEEKASFYSEDISKLTRLSTSLDYRREKVHFWRDNFRHFCHPLEEHIKDWPTNPTQYKDVMGKYAVHVRDLTIMVLDLICEGLDLESGYFHGELSEIQIMSVNHYPACPDPSLTLGLPKHSDPNLITVLNQGTVSGLQIWQDEEWCAVEPVPNAFVVNIGYALQMISNGKLRSCAHRVVTNADTDRMTIASFISPSRESQLVPPIKFSRNSDGHIYKPVTYLEFFMTYAQDIREGKDPLKRYESSSSSSSCA